MCNLDATLGANARDVDIGESEGTPGVKLGRLRLAVPGMPATNGTMCYVFDDERCLASGWTRRTSLTSAELVPGLLRDHAQIAAFLTHRPPLPHAHAPSARRPRNRSSGGSASDGEAPAPHGPRPSPICEACARR